MRDLYMVDGVEGFKWGLGRAIKTIRETVKAESLDSAGS